MIASENQTELHLNGFNRIRVDRHHSTTDMNTYIDQQIAASKSKHATAGDTKAVEMDDPIT
jgi:N-acetylglutamate synthase/N-acetylornithine aminotransferase